MKTLCLCLTALFLVLAGCEAGGKNPAAPGQEKPAILSDPTRKVELLAFSVREGTDASRRKVLSFQPELRYESDKHGAKIGIVFSGRDGENAEVLSHTIIFTLGTDTTPAPDLNEPLVISPDTKGRIVKWVPVRIVTY